ncbi:MAG TPA: AAA family ATPase, partial [Polyangia bacterium]
MRPIGTDSHEPTPPSDGLPPIVHDLLRPEALRRGARGAVELRSTHASWVFLCGADVFKLKRPVDLGFLDFRTVEARRRDCEDEVRLNRRLAPDVYLGVLPVRRDAAGHRVDAQGEGDVADWVVHMRRLPDDASAASLLAQGRLDRERLAALALTVAASLDAAPSAPRFGEVAALRHNVEENLAQSRAFAAPDGMVEPEALEAIWRYHDRALRLRSEVFATRARAGRIREGHGDLRLEHVYFLPSAPGAEPERPVVIDCLEFSERLRAGDVASELAFLAMELEAAGQPALGAGFVARGAEALDDFDLYGVLDFYLAYRAWVRAKVAGFVARDPQADHPVRARKLEEARLYFSLARASGRRPVARPALVAVGGVIGSGKSTLAAALGAELAAPVVGSDRTRKAMAGLSPTARGSDELYT